MVFALVMCGRWMVVGGCSEIKLFDSVSCSEIFECIGCVIVSVLVGAEIVYGLNLQTLRAA